VVRVNVAPRDHSVALSLAFAQQVVALRRERLQRLVKRKRE
jgi:hypothetical protein